MTRTRYFCLSLGLLFLGSSIASAQLLYQQGFEVEDDGYELNDPGYEESTGDSGPGIWGRNTDGDQIGLVQNAPEKRAAILWTHDDIAAETFTEESLDVWSSLVSWAVDDKDGATVGIFPSTFPLGNSLIADKLTADGHKIEEIFDVLDADSVDVLIHTSEQASTALSEAEVPIISFSAGDHDDTAIAGIGPTINFFDPVTIDIPAAANGHPALGGKTGTISWTSDAADGLQGIGKPHNGGTVLATVVYEDPGTGDDIESPAIFVIEKGAPLLGAFNPKPADGQHYIVGAALNKFGDAGERTVELDPIDISGQSDLKLTVSLAATAADFETGDYLRIEADIDGKVEIIDEFYGVSEAFDPANESGCLKGLSNGPEPGDVGDFCLPTEAFGDFEFDLPSGDNLVLRFAAINTWGNEIVAIDNVRVSSGPIGPVGDFDGDGSRTPADIDLLTAALGGNDATFDLSGDGNVDGADRDAFIELSNTYMGDSNWDGEFNSSDFVAVFAAAKYESGQAASWGEGDWNGDGQFNSSDFVAAFSGGGYEKGPRDGGLQVVPEPASCTLLFAGSLLLLSMRRK